MVYANEKQILTAWEVLILDFIFCRSLQFVTL